VRLSEAQGHIDGGLITGLYAVRNPEKLSHMEQETTLRHWVWGRLHLEVNLKPVPDREIVDVAAQRRSPVNRVLTGCSRGAAAGDRLPRAREELS
jgi:hypothetical protein